MKNSSSAKHRSITRKLTLGLIITLVAVAGLSLVVNFVISSHKANTELERKADEYISGLTETLKHPLWTYNEDMIKAIGALYSQDEFVARLLIEGQDNLIFFKSDKPDERSVVARSVDILHDDEFIGRIQVSLSARYYDTISKQLFLSSSITILSMIGALLVMTGLLLRQYLAKPLSAFTEMVQSYTAGHTGAFKQTLPYSEFISLVNVMDEMGAKIESQMRSLQLTQYAVDSSSVAIYWTDTDAHIIYANQSATRSVRYSSGELAKLSLADIDFHWSNQHWREQLEKLKSHGSITFESEHRRKDYSTFPIEMTATFLKYKDQEYIFAFVSDITNRRRAEEQIRKLEEFEQFSKLAVGREIQMIELKKEINDLHQHMNEPEKYRIVS